MKRGLSMRLAWGNLKKNYRFFLPRILSEVGLAASFYIIFTLSCDRRLASVKGGAYLPTIMWMGAVVIGLLSAVLTLYVNGFLMKQRKREFGLYSVLGMEKKHICRVLFCESLLCSLTADAGGLLFGMLFYKAASLAICRLLHAEVVAGFYFITPGTVIPVLLIFLGLDLFTFLVNCVSVGRMSTVELLSSVSAGEKEPRVRWFLLVPGILCLGSGYAISLLTKEPLQALFLFFAAVLLVIAGTYLLFVSGSTLVLKALKKNEAYYYRPGHFTAVSGLIYRMKRNAVGLASVAILSTGVLIMISSTFCLYSRTEAVLKQNYPQDCYLPLSYLDEEGKTVFLDEKEIGALVKDCAARNGLTVREEYRQTYFETAFSHQPGALISDRASYAVETDLASLTGITFLTEEDYVLLGGTPIGLKKGEVAVCPYNMAGSFGEEEFTMCGGTYRVRARLTSFPVNSRLVSVNCFGMVVADREEFDRICQAQAEAYGTEAVVQTRYCVSFENASPTSEAGETFAEEAQEALFTLVREKSGGSYTLYGIDTVWSARESYYGMYGTLLFLGILLGLVCLFAAVLIIYFKQISEGSEDRGRFRIMRKIGMTDAEVRGTVKTQVLTVFFLPLVTAGIHTAFAYPIVTRIMEVMLLDDRLHFAMWCAVTYAAFALVYTLIYALTARTYYQIVG